MNLPYILPSHELLKTRRTMEMGTVITMVMGQILKKSNGILARSRECTRLEGQEGRSAIWPPLPYWCHGTLPPLEIGGTLGPI